jgi:hypothetical protein
MQQGAVSFDISGANGPYEYVLQNGLGPLWFTCIIVFLIGVYFLARRKPYRVISPSLLQMMKFALSVEAFSCCVFSTVFAYDLSSYSISTDDLISFLFVITPCILGSLCWAYSLRRARVELQLMSILKLGRK